MDKKRLLELVLVKLREDANAMLAAAQATREEATHEDNKAENKYDTRGLEASYLAEAQARQAEEAGIGLARFEAMTWREFGPGAPVGMSALVGVEMGGVTDFYLLGPAAGGMEIKMDGEECTLLTADSPMGKRLLGAREGDRFEINGRAARIVSVR